MTPHCNTLRVVACVASLLVPQPVQAVACSASTAGLAFGPYNLLSPVPVTSTATVRITCSLEPADGPTQRVVASRISLSAGGSGSVSQRQMASGNNRLNYNIFTTNGYGTVWGDGSGGSATRSVAFTLNPARPTRSEDLVGYGRVPALQDPAAGTYGDVLVVTVMF